jgi:hypothetical protein
MKSSIMKRIAYSEENKSKQHCKMKKVVPGSDRLVYMVIEFERLSAESKP